MTLHSHVASVEQKRDIMIFIYNPLETNLELFLCVDSMLFPFRMFCFPSSTQNCQSNERMNNRRESLFEAITMKMAKTLYYKIASFSFMSNSF